MADRAEVAGLTLPRPPAIATKARTIFGGHFGDRKLLQVNKGRNGLSHPTKKIPTQETTTTKKKKRNPPQKKGKIQQKKNGDDKLFNVQSTDRIRLAS